MLIKRKIIIGFSLVFLLASIGLSSYFVSKKQVKAATGDSPSNRIGTRLGSDGYGEFYDVVTDNIFIPRGNNHIRVDGVNHNMFDPASYDSSVIEAALSQMQSYGYNITRIFLDHKKLGGLLTEPGVDPAYMSNLIDYLNRARTHGIYVIITLSFLPSNYDSIVDSLPPTPYCEAGGTNTLFMSSRHIVAYKAMLVDIAEYINTADSSLLSTVFTWDIRNESHYKSDVEPFSMTSGNIVPAEGGTYDMSSTVSRQLAADNSAKFWVNQMSEGIKSVDPNALVETSVFTPKAVSRDGYDGVAPTSPAHPDNRLPFRPTTLYDSNLDLIDIHQYQLGTNYNIALDLGSAEIGILGKDKPRLMSEFGALKSYYPNLSNAVLMLKSHLASVCSFGFRGGLFWNWDETDLTDYWTALEGGGVVNNNISKNAYPNPCGSAPLILSKTVDKTYAKNGEVLIYTINYINGSSQLSDARIEDSIPAGTSFISADSGGMLNGTKVIWNIGNINTGAGGTVSFQVRIQ